ncbi:MAG: TlpA disulfide reductase family protein, partial [Sulfuriferula sp.]
KFVLYGVLAVALATMVYLGLTQKNSAPALTMTTLSGQTVNLAQFRGKTVLVNFWATSCPGCVKEMPHLVDMYQRYHGKGLEIVAVSMSYDPATQVRRFSAERNLPFPVVMDTQGDIARAFGEVKLTPTTFLIDAEGNIAEQTIGDLDFMKLQQRLDGVNKL